MLDFFFILFNFIFNYCEYEARAKLCCFSTSITVLVPFQGHSLHAVKAVKTCPTAADNLLVSIGTDAGGLVVLGAVHVGTVIESAVSPPDGSSPPLVEEMPVEARKGSMLRALVLKEERALLCPELLQISATGVDVESTRQ